MILGVGTDIAEVGRIRESIARYGDRFLKRVYTEGERSYAMRRADPAERFAARFAAKEAGMKAVGTGWRRGVTWLDFEVVNQLSGRPTLRLSGIAREIADSMGVQRVSLSLTHSSAIAFAFVLLENSGPAASSLSEFPAI